MGVESSALFTWVTKGCFCLKVPSFHRPRAVSVPGLFTSCACSLRHQRFFETRRRLHDRFFCLRVTRSHHGSHVRGLHPSMLLGKPIERVHRRQQFQWLWEPWPLFTWISEKRFCLYRLISVFLCKLKTRNLGLLPLLCSDVPLGIAFDFVNTLKVLLLCDDVELNPCAMSKKPLEHAMFELLQTLDAHSVRLEAEQRYVKSDSKVTLETQTELESSL